MTTTPDTVRTRTLEAIPGYHEAVSRLERARLEMRTTNEGLLFEKAYKEMEDRIIALLDAGESIPLDIGKDAAQAEIGDRAIRLRAQVMKQHAPNQNELRERFITAGADHALAHLATELATVVTEVKKISRTLRGVSSPMSAMRAGQAASDAWLKVVEYTDTYDEIRTVQFELYRDVVPDSSAESLARIVLFRESIDVLPYWTERRHTSANRSRAYTEPARTYVDWLTSATPAWNEPAEPWWPTADREEHLLTVCTTLSPWVPTAQTYMKAVALAGTATGPVVQDIPTQQEAARRDYYTLTSAPTDTDITPTDHKKIKREQAVFERKLAKARSIGNIPKTQPIGSPL